MPEMEMWTPLNIVISLHIHWLTAGGLSVGTIREDEMGEELPCSRCIRQDFYINFQISIFKSKCDVAICTYWNINRYIMM
jgi:hypothetical protein